MYINVLQLNNTQSVNNLLITLWITIVQNHRVRIFLAKTLQFYLFMLYSEEYSNKLANQIHVYT